MEESFTAVDGSISGMVLEKFQLHLTLQEQTANVDDVKELLKGHVGFEVLLIDCKHLPVLPGKTSSGE